MTNQSDGGEDRSKVLSHIVIIVGACSCIIGLLTAIINYKTADNRQRAPFRQDALMPDDAGKSLAKVVSKSVNDIKQLVSPVSRQRSADFVRRCNGARIPSSIEAASTITAFEDQLCALAACAGSEGTENEDLVFVFAWVKLGSEVLRNGTVKFNGCALGDLYVTMERVQTSIGASPLPESDPSHSICARVKENAWETASLRGKELRQTGSTDSISCPIALISDDVKALLGLSAATPDYLVHQ
jgi:hypothetical protein